jgi:choloylglycine hydrolase
MTLANRVLSVLATISLASVGHSGALACTSFLLKGNDGGSVYGRTMEFGMPMRSRAILIQRGTRLVGVGPDGKAGSGLPWTSRYAVAGLNALGLDMVVDGMNEKGLAGGLLNFPGWARYQAVPAGQARRSIVSLQMLTYVLSQYGTLEEVKAGLPKILVNGAPLGSFGGTAQVHMTPA